MHALPAINFNAPAALAAAVAALGGVFLLYTRPAFLVTLVDQIWACF